jgi:hypothetical protein
MAVRATKVTVRKKDDRGKLSWPVKKRGLEKPLDRENLRQIIDVSFSPLDY